MGSKVLDYSFPLLFLFLGANVSSQTAPPPRISASITADSLGPSGPQAAASVMRITCWGIHPGPFQQIGTGFLHKSGVVITAKHTLEECWTKDFRLAFTSTKHIKATAEGDPLTDLALLRPTEKLTAATLGISQRVSIDVGEKLYIWGFPDGYSATAPPLLTIGHLSGIDRARPTEPIGWVVNAPFRSGSSGGPIVSSKDSLVIGVVSARINYFPAHLSGALESLSRQKSGPKYVLPADDGSKVSLTQTQVIALILRALRKDHDRLLGFAVAASDLRNFLQSKKIDP